MYDGFVTEHNRNTKVRMRKRMGNRKKRSVRNRRKKIIFGIEILVLIVLGSGLFLFTKVKDKMSSIHSVDLDKSKIHVNEEILEAEKTRQEKGFQTIALIGVDSRKDEGGSIKSGQSDTMMIASINNDAGKVRLVSVYRDTYLQTDQESDSFTKANAAYNRGGYYSFLNMLNRNLDLSVSDFVAVDFMAMSRLVDALGGLDVTMTHDEIVHMNNYCKGTAKETGDDYEEIEPVEGTYHLNGVQVVSYMRIRKGEGLDFQRTVRQREIIYKLIDTAKKAGLSTLYDVMDEVFPYIYTNLSKNDMISMGMNMLGYELEDTAGFPFDHIWGSVTMQRVGQDCIIPVTLENNVKQLHEFLYPGQKYTPSETMKAISREISERSGYTEADIPEESFHGEKVRVE